jgi:hypothetical protein
LPTNNRLNAYIREVDPRCTFCILGDANSQQRDSFGHCFFGCHYVKNFLTKLFSSTRFAGVHEGLENDTVKNLYWYGIYDTVNLTLSKKFCYLLFFDSARFVIFRHRQRRQLIPAAAFITEMQFFLECIFRSNKKFKNNSLIPMSSRIFFRRLVSNLCPFWHIYCYKLFFVFWPILTTLFLRNGERW